VCTLPGSALPPGSSHSVEIVVAGGNGKTYRNCATMVQPNRSPIAVIGSPSCAEGGTGGSISVLKTAPAACAYDKDCTFQVTITNDSPNAFSGALLVGDLMRLGGVEVRGASIVSISPPLNCDAAASSLPFSCKASTSLAGHESHSHTIVVHMPPAGLRGTAATDGLNCFMAVDAAGAAPGTGDAIAAAAVAPGNGQGYSCVAFKMEQPEVCPGDLRRIGTQCKCPEGTKQGANYKCIGGNDTPPPPPPSTKKHCEAPLVGSYPDCSCPLDKPVFTNGQCKPRTVSKDCQAPLVGTYPNCHCPRGTSLTAAGACEAPTKQCQAPLVGDYPNCHPPITIQCPAGTTGVFPLCKPNQTDQCKRGEVKVDGTHCCPPGYTWDGKCYPPAKGGTGGGDTPPKCAGVLVHGVCLGNQGDGSKRPQNIFCKRGTKWNGSTCVPIGSDVPNQPSVPISPGIKQQLNIPGLFLKQAPRIN